MDDGWMKEGNLSVPNRMLNCHLLNFHQIFINLSIELMNSYCAPVYLSIYFVRQWIYWKYYIRLHLLWGCTIYVVLAEVRNLICWTHMELQSTSLGLKLSSIVPQIAMLIEYKSDS